MGGSGGPRGSLHNPKRLTMRFLGMYGGFVERKNSYSTAASSFATPFVLGSNQVGFDAGSLEDSELIILWGANIVDNRFGSELESRIREARTRGVRVVVIEPRKTRTVKTLGTDWLPVYPGTDSALMLAVLHVLITEELVDREYIDKYCYGFDELERHVLGLDDGFPKTP
ncbi:molybdopterin-dependent oxidoreductase, partial [Candidatus Bathyarchaeota archaeon]|nr:molybdopterin-dependent oxidoreductase [Candidatus Bathyarchaeota archaeon]